MNGRRSFLCQLATLPLIGGKVELIGRPTAAAVPVTEDLLEAYKTWLHFERRSVSWEMAQLPEKVARYRGSLEQRFEYIDRYIDCVGQSADYHSFDGTNPASGRAALVMSAVGCDWQSRT